MRILVACEESQRVTTEFRKRGHQAFSCDLVPEIGEIVYYSEDLSMYLWGVTHLGTSWNYVLTNIPCVND